MANPNTEWLETNGDTVKVGDEVPVKERVGSVLLSCEVVGIADRDSGVIVVDDGRSLRLARWIGSDDRHFAF